MSKDKISSAEKRNLGLRTERDNAERLHQNALQHLKAKQDELKVAETKVTAAETAARNAGGRVPLAAITAEELKRAKAAQLKAEDAVSKAEAVVKAKKSKVDSIDNQLSEFNKKHTSEEMAALARSAAENSRIALLNKRRVGFGHAMRAIKERIQITKADSLKRHKDKYIHARDMLGKGRGGGGDLGAKMQEYMDIQLEYVRALYRLNQKHARIEKKARIEARELMKEKNLYTGKSYAYDLQVTSEPGKSAEFKFCVMDKKRLLQIEVNKLDKIYGHLPRDKHFVAANIKGIEAMDTWAKEQNLSLMVNGHGSFALMKDNVMLDTKTATDYLNDPAKGIERVLNRPEFLNNDVDRFDAATGYLKGFEPDPATVTKPPRPQP